MLVRWKTLYLHRFKAKIKYIFNWCAIKSDSPQLTNLQCAIINFIAEIAIELLITQIAFTNSPLTVPPLANKLHLSKVITSQQRNGETQQCDALLIEFQSNHSHHAPSVHHRHNWLRIIFIIKPNLYIETAIKYSSSIDEHEFYHNFHPQCQSGFLHLKRI